MVILAFEGTRAQGNLRPPFDLATLWLIARDLVDRNLISLARVAFGDETETKTSLLGDQLLRFVTHIEPPAEQHTG